MSAQQPASVQQPTGRPNRFQQLDDEAEIAAALEQAPQLRAERKVEEAAKEGARCTPAAAAAAGGNREGSC